jgi:hypothetical protein
MVRATALTILQPMLEVTAQQIDALATASLSSGSMMLSHWWGTRPGLDPDGLPDTAESTARIWTRCSSGQGLTQESTGLCLANDLSAGSVGHLRQPPDDDRDLIRA